MSEARSKFVSKASVTLKHQLRARNATRDLAEKLAKGTDLVSRWATGDRRPIPLDRASLQDECGIDWRDWDELLNDEQAAGLATKLEEASAEPAPTFQVDDKPANGGSHAA